MSAAEGTNRPLEVWIDLANSPHPLLFAPVVRRLEELGHSVVITARDHAQTVELTQRTWQRFDVVGGSEPGEPTRQGADASRPHQRPAGVGRDRRPDVALSHNSYAQIVAARTLRVPIVTAMDFEHQPANHLAFRLATLVLLPEALPGAIARRQGATKRKVWRYPGLKEAIYLGDFEPDPDVLSELGLARSDERALVVARTPPARALYHRFGNPLFAEALRVVARQPHVQSVVLARHPEQVSRACRDGPPQLHHPLLGNRFSLTAVQGRSGDRRGRHDDPGGGAMGVPTFTLFAGRAPAVDRWLEGSGRAEAAHGPRSSSAP